MTDKPAAFHDCPQCGEPDVCMDSERICVGCVHDNDAEDFDRCEGVYGWDD